MFVRACVQVQKVDGLQKLVKEFQSSASTSRNELNQLLQRLDEMQVRSLSHTYSLSYSVSPSHTHTLTLPRQVEAETLRQSERDLTVALRSMSEASLTSTIICQVLLVMLATSDASSGHHSGREKRQGEDSGS
jgi:hypothetical protein